MRYEDFVTSKLSRVPPTGLAEVPGLHSSLFPHQRDLVAWSLRRGCAALFADTGLGKTAMQIEWARHVADAHADRMRRDVLILAPLAVAAQTAREADRLGVVVNVCRDGGDVRPGINITNYERIHRFETARFAGVVLDESSVIKHHDAKTLRVLLDAFRDTPFKLCATATPSPNDYAELGTHAEFLGICTRTEMLSEFFVHDGGETQAWRLKGHARAEFWRWVASWAAMLRNPADLGYDGSAYALPRLTAEQHTIAADVDTVRASGLLFAEAARTLGEQRDARRGSLAARVKACADIVNADRQPWVVWGDLNAETDALARAIDGAVEIAGSDTTEEKERALSDFAEGRARVLVSKVSICGWGLNWQHCARMAFVGVTHSWEAYYQAVRRCWRFGQTRPVDVHIFASELEGRVIANLQRKERDANAMADALVAETKDAVRAEVRGLERQTNDYKPSVAMALPNWMRRTA
jgi:hypothetical protein